MVFFTFFDLKSLIILFSLLKFRFFLSIKWYFPLDLSFYLIFLCFLMFLSSTCFDVYLFVGFYIDDLDNSAALIR